MWQAKAATDVVRRYWIVTFRPLLTGCWRAESRIASRRGEFDAKRRVRVRYGSNRTFTPSLSVRERAHRMRSGLGWRPTDNQLQLGGGWNLSVWPT